ncbi:MAG: hypothetical protein HW404_1935 [Anaerolineales bacterium]|nr:hypothetical protein [Anaerolineales bacterium]
MPGRQAGLDGLLGDPARPAADGHQFVGDAGRPRSDHAVAGFLIGAQLEHVAQHGQVASFELGQQVEGSDGRLGRGVVGVVEQDRSARPGHGHQAQLGVARLQPSQDLLPRHPFHQADGRRPQRRMHRMLAEHRHADVLVLAPVMQGEAHPIQAESDDLIGPQVGLRAQAVGEHTRPGSDGHRSHALVVVIEDGDPLGGRRQGFDKLSLPRYDRLHRAGPFQMHRADIGDHAHLRPGDVAQQGDLPRHVEAHLQHGPAVIAGQLEDRQRQADLVVEVAEVAQGAEPSFEQLGGDFLGSRLPQTAGDADDMDRQARTPVAGGLLQRRQHVRHAQQADVGECEIRRQRSTQIDHRPGTQAVALDEGGPRPSLEGLGQEVMAVDLVPLQGEEEGPRDDLARIDDGGPYRRAGAAPDPPGQGFDRQLESEARRRHLSHLRPPSARPGWEATRGARRAARPLPGRRAPPPQIPTGRSPACPIERGR